MAMRAFTRENTCFLRLCEVVAPAIFFWLTLFPHIVQSLSSATISSDLETYHVSLVVGCQFQSNITACTPTGKGG